MKHLALIVLALLIGCGSPNEPDAQGFTPTAVPGEWTHKGVISIRLSGEYVDVDPYGHEAFIRKPGAITVKGSQVSFWVNDPFHVSVTDVLYFEGEMAGGKITGKQWTNYNAHKMNMIFTRTK